MARIALEHLGFGAVRRRGQAVLRVYNADLKEHGYESGFTFVEMVNDDMPFLVDSVMGELADRKLEIHLAAHPVIGVRRDGDKLTVHASLQMLNYNITELADALERLVNYPWPGNVRELENVIERTVALETSELISSGSLPDHLRGAPRENTFSHTSLPEEGIDLEEHLSNVRAELMRQALERSGGQQKRAAELLRLSYRAFRYHADKLGLVKDDEGES